MMQKQLKRGVSRCSAQQAKSDNELSYRYGVICIHYTHLRLADDDVTEHGDDDKRVSRDLEKKTASYGTYFQVNIRAA